MVRYSYIIIKHYFQVYILLYLQYTFFGGKLLKHSLNYSSTPLRPSHHHGTHTLTQILLTFFEGISRRRTKNNIPNHDNRTRERERKRDNNLDDVQIEEIQYDPTVVWKSIKAGKFLLVNFLGGLRNKTQFKYVCLVQSVDDDDGDVVIQGPKKINSIGTEFSINDGDMCTITTEIIEAILPDPNMIMKGRKVVYKFKGFIKVNEK